MNEITTLTVNGETYRLRDSAAESALEELTAAMGDVAAALDAINGEAV